MTYEPLAERLRPRSLDDYIGQRHLVGPGAVIRRMIESGNISSFILWGPPGVGKTTLARIIAETTQVPFYTLSAVTSGVKDVREVLDRCKADARSVFSKGRPILFIDEIHRFNKSQQDVLLPYVEDGTVVLIGATTHNPNFFINTPITSRSLVFELHALGSEDVAKLLDRALADKEKGFGNVSSTIDDDARDFLAKISDGDARHALTALEIAMRSTPKDEKGVVHLTLDVIQECVQRRQVRYDKKEDGHYDTISAFIKSIRGSDPDAAIYWLARMIEGGEDPAFIARRLVISASEDIGLANPNALLLANAAFDAVQKIGWPEGRIPLAEATVYLATSPKSNSAYNAVNAAIDNVRQTGNQPVPLHLRNAPTELMSELGYSDGYKYPHDYPGHYVQQQYMPDALVGTHFFHVQENDRIKDTRNTK